VRNGLGTEATYQVQLALLGGLGRVGVDANQAQHCLEGWGVLGLMV